MTVSTLDVLLRIGLAVLVVLGLRVAWYEGASWRRRVPEQSWWRTLMPDRLLRADLHTPEGNELRRRAVRSLVLWVVLGALMLAAIAYRNALEAQ